MGLTGPVGLRDDITGAEEAAGVDGRWGHDRHLRRTALRSSRLFDSLSDHRLDNNGIRPLETDGLLGIVFAPLLHANWDHLIANTLPALILGFLMTLAGMSRFIFATAIIWILGGLRHVADRQCRRALPVRRCAL